MSVVIATFQAVGQRAADAYIDTEAIRLTAWQACWRLAEELPATAEVAVAKLDAGASGRDAHFYGGKLAVAHFFAKTVLPELSARRAVVDAADTALMDVDVAVF